MLFITSFILLTVMIVALQIYQSRHRFKLQAATMRSDHITRQKAQIEHEVERVVASINYQRTQCNQQTQDTTQQRVYQAYAIAQNIYNQYHLTKSAQHAGYTRPICDQGHDHYYRTTG